jgi:hypothetical protein
MPSDRRHNRSLNMRDEVWDWLHRAYLASGSVSPERQVKSDYVEEVIVEGIRAVARKRGVSDCFRPPTMAESSLPAVEPPPLPPPAAPVPSAVRQPLATSRIPRLSAEERRLQRATRLLQQTAPTLHPPVIPTAASRPESEVAAP